MLTTQRPLKKANSLGDAPPPKNYFVCILRSYNPFLLWWTKMDGKACLPTDRQTPKEKNCLMAVGTKKGGGNERVLSAWATSGKGRTTFAVTAPLEPQNPSLYKLSSIFFPPKGFPVVKADMGDKTLGVRVGKKIMSRKWVKELDTCDPKSSTYDEQLHGPHVGTLEYRLVP